MKTSELSEINFTLIFTSFLKSIFSSLNEEEKSSIAYFHGTIHIHLDRKFDTFHDIIKLYAILHYYIRDILFFKLEFSKQHCGNVMYF